MGFKITLCSEQGDISPVLSGLKLFIGVVTDPDMDSF